MARFFPLEVADIRRETRDAVVVTLAPRIEDRAAFDFTQGQYLTFRRDFEGEELRRSYSICAGKDEGVLKVGIKRVDGGAFSSWANEELKPGDVLEAMPPMGAFHVPLKPEERRHYLAFAGGSGITPVLSLIKTALAREPKSRFTLVYGNRSVNSIMFREELEDIKNVHLGRFNVVHVLESEAQEVELFSGRIDAEKCARLFKGWINIAAIDMAFICGPEPMMLAIAAALREHGLRDDQIKFELFASAPRRAKHVARTAADNGKAAMCTATITLDGTTRVIEMAKTGQTILEAALGASLDAPYACKAGVCSTCRAMVVEGEVEMATNHALEDYEVRQGYVLTCQCYPLSDRVVVTYDQ
ncbi:phenylacetic acid degradation protein [Bosea sp. Root483D1]|uniref:1,2-phenylacetyl-CoA epoxidase subunit PaaE n=1 Tax=Bosea sp. Root483D1 TaxID=1736544 RepID=UPI00070C5888|nr:1,2-phenylacetyl-CoA epoxidase subunit PaaE [Bosea sp. Root483D1]KRE20630.1 phenylacetic acid degradation protein [Bosea sp. Root483D1]